MARAEKRIQMAFENQGKSTYTEQQAVAFANLNNQVQNGGFEQYATNGYIKDIQIVYNMFFDMGTRITKKLTKVLAKVDQAYREYQEAEGDPDYAYETYADKLEDLDDKYDEIDEEDLYEQVALYLGL